MKTIKYLFVGALLTVFSASAMAQATVDDAVKAIKSNQDKKAVEATVKEALKPYKKDAEQIAKIGRAYLDVKDTANARKYADMAIQCELKKKTDKKAAGYILMGDLEYFNDNPGDAAANYQNAIYFEPKNPQGYIKYARTNRGVSPDLAVEQLQKVRELIPDYPVDAEAAHIYYEAAKKNASYMPKVTEFYGKVSLKNLYDHDPSYVTEYALACFASQKNDKSKEIAVFGLTQKPRHAGYNRLALYNSVELKQYDEAEKYVDALFNKSDSVELTNNDYKYAGITFNALKKYDEAIVYYNKQFDAATSDAAKAAVLKDLSDAYKAKGDYATSLVKYEEYLKINPNVGVNDYANLANIYRNQATEQQGAEQEASVRKAVSIYEDMIQKYPTSADYSNFMAARTMSIIDADQSKGLARPYYEKLAQSIEAAGVKDKSDRARIIEAYTYLGIYLFKIKNDNEAAKPYFEKLQQIDPENALAKQVLESYQ